MHGWGMGMIWLVWIPLIVLIVWLIVRQMKRTSSSGGEEGSPLEVLKKRYANGEITSEEFEQKKRRLEE